MRTGFLLPVGLLLVAALVGIQMAKAQSGTRSGGGMSRPRPRTQAPRTQAPRTQAPRREAPKKPRYTAEEFQKAFWKKLTQGESPYSTWDRWAGKDDLVEGQSPHGAFVKTYLNPTAVMDTETLPSGSILVKENYDDDKETLLAITVMYRSKGYDPKHNDWYWIKYLPDGAVAKMPKEMGGKPVAGKLMMCVECHHQAHGDDLVFGNDDQ